jgi:hypothetical protein
MERRDFIHSALLGLAGTVTATAVSKHALAKVPEPIYQPSAGTAPPWRGPETEGPEARYRPVVTLNGWTLSDERGCQRVSSGCRTCRA